MSYSCGKTRTVLIYTIALLVVLSEAKPEFPGDPCDPVTDRCNDVPLTECKRDDLDQYRCLCHDGLLTDTVNKRCIPRPQRPGDACAPNVPGVCGLISNTECGLDGGTTHVCKCTGSLITLPGRCLTPPTMPGEECEQNLAPCTAIPNTDCTLKSGNEYFCKCTGDLVTDVPGKKCLTKPLRPGESCHSTLTPCENVDLTTCQMNDAGQLICKCIPGYQTDPVGGRCLRIPTAPGEPCDLTWTPCPQVQNTTCESDNGVDNYYCKCIEDFVTDPSSKTCLQRPTKPGKPCHPTLTPCEGAGLENTECQPNENEQPGQNFYCKCVGDFVNDFAKERCLKLPTAPGHECLPGLAPCTGVERTECRFNVDKYVCTCDAGLVTDSVNERCIAPPTKPGDDCAPNAASPCGAIPDTTCVIDDGPEHVCKCSGTLITLPGKCLVAPQMPGEECHPTKAQCTGIANTNCVVKIGDEHYCKCTGDLVTDVPGKKCLTKPQRPGQSCHPNLTPCEGVDLTTCQMNEVGENICKCTAGYFTDVDAGRCLRIPTQPGDSCHPQLTPCAQVTNTTCSTDNGFDNHYCKCTGDLVTDPSARICLEKPGKPGKSCHPTLTPCVGVGLENTACEQDGSGSGPFYCKCVGDFVNDFEKERCLKRPQLPGQECLPQVAPCTNVELTECRHLPDQDKFLCMCNSGLVTDIAHARCIAPPSYPGDPCEITLAPCGMIPNTTCATIDPDPDPSNLPLCKCDPAFVQDFPGKRCVKIPTHPGQPCEPGFTDCSATGGDTPTTCERLEAGPNFYCKCASGFETDVGNQVCLKIPARPGEPCNVDLTPCSGITNTTCQVDPSDGVHKCACDEPLVTDEIGGRCLTKPTLPGHHCHPRLTPCDHVVDTECRPLPLPDESGESMCTCVGDLVTDPAKGICIRPPENPGDICHPTDAPCTDVPETECQEENDQNICKCTGDLITDPVNRRCFSPPTRPGQTCDPILAKCVDIRDTECRLKAPSLTEYYCECNAGLVTDVEGGRCIRIPINPGDECLPNIDLCQLVGNTTCVNDGAGGGYRCKCVPDLHTEHGKCFPTPTKPGDSCGLTTAPCTGIPDTTCVLDAEGNRGYHCKCGTEFFTDFIIGRCVRHPTAPGHPCDSKDPRTCNLVQNATCLPIGEGFFECKCDAGFFQDGLCVPWPEAPMGRCLTQVHCDPIPNTECEFETPISEFRQCVCRLNFDISLDESTCLKKAEFVGDSCERDLQCSLLGKTYCEENPAGVKTCACERGTVESLTGRECVQIVSELDLNCTESVQCEAGIGPDSECPEGTNVCTCKVGFIGNPTRNKCLKVSPIDGDCEENIQCTAQLGELSLCTTEKKCACTPNAGFLRDKCYRKLRLYDECERLEECIVGTNELAYCHAWDRLCYCTQGSITWASSCWEDLSIGSPCGSHAECYVAVSNSSCQGNVCQCDNPSSPPITGGKTCSRSGAESTLLSPTATATVQITLLIFPILQFSWFRF